MKTIRRWLGRLFLMVISLGLMLLLAEGMVRLLSWGAPLTAFHREAKPDGSMTWSVPSEKQESIALRFALHPTRFDVPKPKGVFRVFVFGGSTVFGMPFTLAAGGNDLSFVSYLRERLARLRPETTIEFVNAGAVGMALNGVTAVFEEALDAQPDLLIVLSGHNEFLPHALLGSRARQRNPLAPRLGHQTTGSYLRRGFHQFVTSWEERRAPDLGTRDWPVVDSMVTEPHHSEADRVEIFSHAKRCYRWMATSANERGIPLVLCTCPSNIRDFQPSSSSLMTDQADRETWMALIEKASHYVEEGRTGDAGPLVERALALDPSGAEAHYLEGRWIAIDDAVAREHLLKALDLDGVVRRAPREINETIRRIALEQGVRLCDIERRFAQEATRGLPGLDLFVDHVHPNLDGVVTIAEQLLDTILDMIEDEDLAHITLGGESPTDQAQPGSIPTLRTSILESLGYNPKLELQVDKQIGLSYANLILLRLHDPEARYRIAVDHLERVREAIPESLRPQVPLYALASTYLGGIHVIAGHSDLATPCFEEAKKYDPNWSKPLLEFLDASSVLRRIFDASDVVLPE